MRQPTEWEEILSDFCGSLDKNVLYICLNILSPIGRTVEKEWEVSLGIGFEVSTDLCHPQCTLCLLLAV